MPEIRNKPARLAPGVPDGHKHLLDAAHWSLQFGVPLVLCSCVDEFLTAESQSHLRNLVSPGPYAEDATAFHLAGFWEWLSRAAEAVISGALPAVDGGAALAAKGSLEQVLVTPRDLVRWFETHGVIMPDEFKELAGGPGPPELSSDHPALDPSHPHYSMELASALRAWEALFMNRGADEPKPPGGYLKLINGWVAKQGSSLGINARERIVSVVNPYKGGGAAPSETKKTVGG